MQEIPDGSVDLIVCDPPYGTINGIGKSTDKFTKDTSWDVIIPTGELFAQYTRILRNNGTLVLFSQEPYTSHLRTFRAKNLVFTYPMIWLKDSTGNPLKAKIAPLSFFEDLSVWRKRIDIVSNEHPLRAYSKALVGYIGKTYQEIGADFIAKGYDKPTRAQHFLAYDCNQFHLCTLETYQLLTEDYNLRNWDGFREFADIKAENERWLRENETGDDFIFNLPEGKAAVSNVLEFRKDLGTFHPTQKPVALIARIIEQYTNPGDLVLDNCMGSATTAVAAIRTKRNWIGFELSADFYAKALARIDETLRTPTLF